MSNRRVRAREALKAPPRACSLSTRQPSSTASRTRATATAHLLENLKLDELAAKQVYEFAFIMQPLKLQGGTGSTVAPVAVR